MLPEKQHLIAFWKKHRVIKSKSVLNAFKKIPRELFVLPQYKARAYDDNPLPILAGQTISQPTTVVLMLDALELKSGNKVLEIGAGSGYNAALISEIIGPKGKVFSTEIIPELVFFAGNNLKSAGIKNVEVLHLDGSQGLPKHAPFDRIVCTAAAPSIPSVLIPQLKINGILLIPVGNAFSQKMIKVKKLKTKTIKENLGDFMFVPLKGKYGVK